jgi:FKBP-type peptidyl-prolyl cis-trans isomerase (trigger factor)
VVIKEIGKREKIEVLPEEIKEETSKFLRHYAKVSDAEKQFDTDDLKEYTYGVLRNKKVFEFLEKL